MSSLYVRGVSSMKVRVVADRMFTDLIVATLAGEVGIEAVDLGADVTVLDAAFSRGNWTASLGELRAGSRPTAIVVLSDDDEEETAVAAARAGVVGWLPAGVAVNELVAVVRTVGAGGGSYPSRYLGAVLRALWSDVESATVTTGGLDLLTERERQVLQFLVLGLAAREIAERMSLSVHTVRSHSHRIFRKLRVHHRLEAVRVARSAGLEPDLDDE